MKYKEVGVKERQERREGGKKEADGRWSPLSFPLSAHGVDARSIPVCERSCRYHS